MTTTVLIIDDQKPILEVFEYCLRDMDCQVDWASSGTQGLEMLAAGRYDIVFLDMNMGRGLDGVETLKQMKASGSRVPVYVVTGFYENYADALLALTKAYGIEFEVLRKPIEAATIRDIISNLKQQPVVR